MRWFLCYLVILISCHAMDDNASHSSLLQSTPPEEFMLTSVCLAYAKSPIAGKQIKLWDDYPYGTPSKNSSFRSPEHTSPITTAREPEETLETHWFEARPNSLPCGSTKSDDPLDSSTPVSVESLFSLSGSSSKSLLFDSKPN